MYLAFNVVRFGSPNSTSGVECGCRGRSHSASYVVAGQSLDLGQFLGDSDSIHAGLPDHRAMLYPRSNYALTESVSYLGNNFSALLEHPSHPVDATRRAIYNLLPI